MAATKATREPRACQAVLNGAKVVRAIVQLHGRWTRQSVAVAGFTRCPVCGHQEALAYSRQGRNGHVWARCRTPGCGTAVE